jgi:transcriptional antiterminator RfaH
MSYWAVVRSLPKREAFAAERLRMDGGFEVFLPLVQTKRASAPLFAGYFFCRIIDRWRSINSTFGVLCLVRVGDCPARCPDAEIDSLKAMIDGHGFVKLPEAPPPPVRRKIAIGAKVRIAAGPFGGMRGLYAGQSTRERELVLLNLLGGQRPVSIAAGLIAPV